MQLKPELLLPAGNVESFYAALEGGADAIFLGLKQFSARGRANNFTYKQFQAIMEEAGKRGVKVYVTLNTVVKNDEIPDLIEYLHFLSEMKADAIIIQDWGVYYIAKKFFPNLPVHASTQMGIHNSLGTKHSELMQFERVILARELTMPELKIISKKSKIQTEIFVHGALCYSFSGMCLFSSYLGGSGANRGWCAQPCRRNYLDNKKEKFLFSLKDNQQLDFTGEFARLGISSLKVEGRMKSADYIYTVGRAYRMALDQSENVREAHKLLEFDFGRKKTSYFMGGNVNDAITSDTATGVFIGKVEKTEPNALFVRSKVELGKGCRIRVQSPGSDERFTFKVKEVEIEKGFQKVYFEKGNAQKGDRIFLTGVQEKKFPSKFKEVPEKKIRTVHPRYKSKILKDLKLQQGKVKDELFLRINSMDWLRKIHLNEFDGVFLSLSRKDWDNFKPEAPFLQKNLRKIHIEFPKFIAEECIEYYRNLAHYLFKKGYRNYVISHLSQKLLVPKGANITTNENVYLFNDAAIKAVQEEGIKQYLYPQESEFENLLKSNDRQGILPVYFYPELFYSRMPVSVESEDQKFSDQKNFVFRRVREDGMTIVVPEVPVSFLQYRSKLVAKGYRRFLLDISYDKPSKGLAKKLAYRLRNSEQVQPSSNFNFKMGMK